MGVVPPEPPRLPPLVTVTVIVSLRGTPAPGGTTETHPSAPGNRRISSGQLRRWVVEQPWGPSN